MILRDYIPTLKEAIIEHCEVDKGELNGFDEIYDTSWHGNLDLMYKLTDGTLLTDVDINVSFDEEGRVDELEIESLNYLEILDYNGDQEFIHELKK